jgi:hypothetical protein
MAKISGEAKKRYFDKVKEYKQETETILAREKNLLGTLRGDGSASQYKRLTLADERMNLASYYLLMNRLSVALLGVKNEAFLNDGRKSCYQAVIYLEEVVSNRLDAPFSEYSEYHEKIEDLDDEKRYRMVRKLGFTIQSVEEDFGENTKWKWSFVELEGRYAVVTKNMLNLKTLVAGLDPRVAGYQARLNHLNLAKELLQRSADRYREKYELSTLRADDFKLGISFLAALRRIHILVGETENADTIKKKMDVWKTKMETDERNARAAKA